MSTALVVAIAFVYLGLLFSVAAYADRKPELFTGPRIRAWVYALTLGVYCTTWTLYGAVGTASQSGWTYLPIYLGPILVFLFGYGMIERLVLIARQQNISSIAHLIAARFGRSQPIGAMVALIALVAAVPYIALQLKAISSSIEVLSGVDASERGLFGDTALYVALSLALFAVVFGTREASATAPRPGLLLAVALESVVKLVALLAVALLALWVSDVSWPQGLQRISADPRWSLESMGTLGFLTQTLLAACAIVCLPRQFHVTVVEAHSADDLPLARKVFVGYLILVSVAVLPIAFMAQGGALPPGNPDGHVLRLPLAHDAPLLALLAFLGGLSAGTAMVIVVSVALSTMLSNELLLPALMRVRRFRLGERQDLSRIVLACRRFSIVLLAVLAFAFYRLHAEGTSLASYGLLAFSAVAQFAPPLFAALYWRNASPAGVYAGLAAGFATWLYTLALPQLLHGGDAQWLSQGPFGFSPLAPQALLGVAGPDPITHGTLWSLLINALTLILVSLRLRPSLSERLQAAPFLDPFGLVDGSAQAVPTRIRQSELFDLAKRIIGRDAAEEAYARYFAEHGGQYVAEHAADRGLMQFSERLLAGAVGTASARLMLTSLLRGSGLELGEVVGVLDEASQALRFNRELLQTTFEHMSQGISVVDAEMRLVAWNQRYEELFQFPDHMLYVGRPIADLIRWNAERGHLRSGDVDRKIERRLAHMRQGSRHRFVHSAPDGRVIELRGEPLPGGGFVTSFTDITDLKRVEEALREANEHLEERVGQRTDELRVALDAQRQARLDAQLAQESRTRFIAAASHDLLQPLSAARLFLSALKDSEGVPLAAQGIVSRTDQALAATEDLLDSLIDVARLDAGALKPDMGAVELAEILRTLDLQFRSVAESRGLRFKVQPTRVYVHSDRKLLRRIVQNFVSNALRYTRTGGVLVGLRRQGHAIRIEVWDSGPGMSEEQQQRLFRDFEQAGSRGSPWGERGTGLGLAGCHRLAHMMGNEIVVRSWPGRGSLFALTVARAAAQEASAPAAQADATATATQPALRVLLVDNEPEFIAASQALMERWGHSAQAAATVQEALARCREQRFDLALIDYQLDGETGFDLLAAWQAQAEIAPRAVVMLSADRGKDLQERAQAIQLKLLYKPVKPAALRAMLAALDL